VARRRTIVLKEVAGGGGPSEGELGMAISAHVDFGEVVRSLRYSPNEKMYPGVHAGLEGDSDRDAASRCRWAPTGVVETESSRPGERGGRGRSTTAIRRRRPSIRPLEPGRALNTLIRGRPYAGGGGVLEKANAHRRADGRCSAYAARNSEATARRRWRRANG